MDLLEMRYLLRQEFPSNREAAGATVGGERGEFTIGCSASGNQLLMAVNFQSVLNIVDYTCFADWISGVAWTGQ
jgi:hypothetical protein